MSVPFIFIATNKLREGKLEDERRRVPGLCDFIEASEPRLIAFNEYANDEGTYAETLEATTSIQVFGTPSDSVLEMLRQQAGSRVALSVKPYHLGGFTRTTAS